MVKVGLYRIFQSFEALNSELTFECAAQFFSLNPGISAQLQIKFSFTNISSIIVFVELDSSGGCVGLFPTRVSVVKSKCIENR